MANSAQQSIANALTPNDGTSYVDGVLTDDNTGQPVDDSNAVVGNDGSILQVIHLITMMIIMLYPM